LAARVIDVPAGIAACTDDPVHPAEVANDWADALPNSCLRETTLDAIGTNRSVLGTAAVSALLDAVALSRGERG
jgi:hypothetical protein